MTMRTRAAAALLVAGAAGLLALVLPLRPAEAFALRPSSPFSAPLRARQPTTRMMSAVPGDMEPGGLGSRRRQSRFNKTPKQPEGGSGFLGRSLEVLVVGLE